MPFHIESEPLPGLIVLRPDRYADNRGYFEETYKSSAFRALGIPDTFVQDNHSRSTAGALRGLHAQVDPPMGKLLRVVRGSIQLVELDVRTDSHTFGRYASIDVSEDNGRVVWIPAGFANGFLVTSDLADVTYKCTSEWNAAGEVFVNPFDTALAIQWQIPAERLVVHPRDAGAPMLAELYARLSEASGLLRAVRSPSL